MTLDAKVLIEIENLFKMKFESFINSHRISKKKQKNIKKKFQYF